ncbi:unnamed protein product, partial [marine sediment metagenome]
ITERKQLTQQTETYAAHIAKAHEEELKRVAHKLHEDTAQSLAALGLTADAMIKAAELGTTFDYLLTGKEGIMPDIIVAIKADGSLNLNLKKALITMVKSLRGSNVSDRIDHNANH